MSAKPPLKSLQPQWLAEEIRQQLLKAAGLYEDADLEHVVIRAYGREAFYLRDLPFHHSQREIASGEDWTDFEYWLRISNDFYTPLLSRGPNIKVLRPQWLADEIRQQLLKAAGLYEGAEGISE